MPDNDHHRSENGDKRNPHDPVIHIDRVRYEAPSAALTGAQLRTLADPDIGSERDLWQEVPGDDDNLVDGGELIQLRNGMHFYSAPSTINPG